MSAQGQGVARPGQYVDAGGLRTYYEVYGSGDPLILLHGGMCPAETLDAQTPAFASKYRVFVPERRGHGRTPDVEGPITYDNMVEDTVAFMDAAGIDSSHLVGWSDGALVGMLVALRRPERVRKLVYISQNLTLDGLRPEAKPILGGMTRETAPPMFEQMYAALSPDGPDHFGVVFDKLTSLWRSDTGVAIGDLERVAAPTLVLVADDDILSLEHATSIHRALANSQLAVVPGTSHPLLMEKPEIVNRLVLDFLEEVQVPKRMPISD